MSVTNMYVCKNCGCHQDSNHVRTFKCYYCGSVNKIKEVEHYTLTDDCCHDCVRCNRKDCPSYV